MSYWKSRKYLKDYKSYSMHKWALRPLYENIDIQVRLGLSDQVCLYCMEMELCLKFTIKPVYNKRTTVGDIIFWLVGHIIFKELVGYITVFICRTYNLLTNCRTHNCRTYNLLNKTVNCRTFNPPPGFTTYARLLQMFFPK